MNVAIFTDNDFNKVNGVTTTLRAVLEHAPSDIRPRIYTCEERTVDRPDYLALKAFGVGIPFYSEMKMYAPPFRRFLRRAAADKIDLIHLTTPGPVGLAAMFVAARLGIRIVGSFHTDLAEYTRVLSGSIRLGTLMQEYMRWPYGKCDRILVPSEATQHTLIKGKINAAKVRIWRRGVSTERFTPAKRSLELRRQWGVHDERPALIYVGRVSKEKGLGELAPLSERLLKSRIDHRFVIVGDGPMRAELEGSRLNAVFTGTLQPDQVAVAMASADLFVFPSRTDTAGNVVLEAQASGLPVLVTDNGGPRENMIDGETGYVCGDWRAFARRIGSLAWNPEHRTRLGVAARRYALGRQWNLALEPLYRTYREAAAPVAFSDRLHARPAVAR
jgi:glycosyltransferase involved in cell wall biosynthesis